MRPAAESKGGEMSRKTVTASLVALLALGALLAPGAFAAKPTLNVIEVDESFPDEFLSEACEVDVTTHVEGRIIERVFDDGTGAAELRTLNLGLTATAGDNTYRFRDVGADLVRIEPDGTAILMLIGQLPFDFTGLLKIDLETGEAILEPQHTTGENVEKACAVLTA